MSPFRREDTPLAPLASGIIHWVKRSLSTGTHIITPSAISSTASGKATRPIAAPKIGATSIELAGTLTDPMNLGALDLRLKLAGASLGNLYPLTGVTLPDTPPYSTDGHLIAKLHDAAGAKFTYEQFNGKIGGSDIHGDLTYVASQPRPKLSGALLSNQLLFADLAPLIGADSNAKQKARGGESKQPTDKVLPVEEFKTDRWRAMDADVEFTGKRIVHSEKLPFNDLYAHVILNDGQLNLQPLRFGVAGGKLDAQIRLNGHAAPLQGRGQPTGALEQFGIPDALAAVHHGQPVRKDLGRALQEAHRRQRHPVGRAGHQPGPAVLRGRG